MAIRPLAGLVSASVCFFLATHFKPMATLYGARVGGSGSVLGSRVWTCPGAAGSSGLGGFSTVSLRIRAFWGNPVF